MVPQVDFDIVRSILRVLEGWELGNKGLYRKNYQHGSIFGRFWVDFAGFWGSFGDDLGVFWGGPRHVLAWKKRLMLIFKKSIF